MRSPPPNTSLAVWLRALAYEAMPSKRGPDRRDGWRPSVDSLLCHGRGNLARVKLNRSRTQLHFLVTLSTAAATMRRGRKRIAAVAR
jgi:hypothetical protein